MSVYAAERAGQYIREGLRDVARAIDRHTNSRAEIAGLRDVARAIDRHTNSRAEIARNSIANMTDEKLERLERVVMALLKLQETGE